MASLGVVSGRLTKDPQIDKTKDGTSVLNVTVASNSYRASKDVTDWIRVRLWSRKAEFIYRYAKKGTKIYASGELCTDQWQDKNGYNHTDMYINANTVEITSNPNREETSQKKEMYSAPEVKTEKAEEEPDDGYGGMFVTDDDLPF